MLTPEDSARIDAWVAEQMRQPWPLTSAQLAVIRRALSDPDARPSAPKTGGRVERGRKR